MNNRNFQYTEFAASSTSSSATVGTHTLTGWSASERYLIIANIIAGARADGLDAGGPFEVGLSDDTGNPGGFTCDVAQQDYTNDMYAFPMIFPFDCAGLSGDPTLQIDLVLPSGTGLVTYRQSGIYPFKLLGNDQTNEDYLTAGSSTDQTTFQTVTGSTVTIAKDGDYFVLACAKVGKGETTANFNIRLALNGTTGYGDQTMRAVSTTKFFPWATMKRLTLVAGDVLTVEHKVTTTGTVSTNNPSIIALYADDLANLLTIEDTADGSAATVATAGTWKDHNNMGTEYRLRAFAALLLSCAQYRRGAAAVDSSMQTLYDGTTVAESRAESVAANTEQTHFATLALDPATAGDHTVVQQHQNHGTGITGAFISDGATAIIGMENNTTVQIYGNCELYGGEIY